jgi:hypothetical protein
MVRKASAFTLADTEAVLELQEELKRVNLPPVGKDDGVGEEEEEEEEAEEGQASSVVSAAPPEVTPQYLGDVRMKRRPSWLLVVLTKSPSIDYRAAALLRIQGADVWPLHRLRELVLAPPPLLHRQQTDGAIDKTAAAISASPSLSSRDNQGDSSAPVATTSTPSAIHRTGSSSRVRRGGEARGKFQLVAPYRPTGDQPGAIANLCRKLDEKAQFMAFKGATGTGKTFVMANVIEHAQRPTLILAPNKVTSKRDKAGWLGQSGYLGDCLLSSLFFRCLQRNCSTNSSRSFRTTP